MSFNAFCNGKAKRTVTYIVIPILSVKLKHLLKMMQNRIARFKWYTKL